MANRLVDNVIIIDSAMGNQQVFMDTGNITNYVISAISFWYGGTNGALDLSAANTADHIIRFSLLQVNTGNAGLTFIPAVEHRSFAEPIRLNTLKVPVVTAGTGWVYLT